MFPRTRCGILHAASQGRTVPNTVLRYGLGSAAHRFARSYALRCVGAREREVELSSPAQIIFRPQPGENVMARKYSKGASKKVEGAMKKRKKGTLKSGRSGKKVKSRKQAIAIGLSEARKSGKKVPKKKTGKKGGRKKSKRKSSKK
jgi:hypothetical protein